MKSAGIQSIAVGFPKTVRNNDWFRDNYPDALAAMESKALAQVFSTKGATESTRAFDQAMTQYLRDPFRGTKRRRVLAPGESQIELERDTALEALSKANLAVEDIDVILTSAFPTENVGVGDGVFLAKALGTRLPAFNVETACSGGLASLQLASAMVQSGQARNVLVVVSCIYSRCCDWNDTLTWFLGDGVGAYVVGEVPRGEGFHAFHALNTAESCGSFSYELEIEQGAPRAVIRSSAAAGKALRDVTPRAIRDACGGVLKKARLTLDDIDLFVPNTPLAWFAELFADTLGIPVEKTVSTYEDYANIGPALNPANLHRALVDGRAGPGTRVLFFSIGSVSTAAAAVATLGDVGVGSLEETG